MWRMEVEERMWRMEVEERMGRGWRRGWRGGGGEDGEGMERRRGERMDMERIGLGWRKDGEEVDVRVKIGKGMERRVEERMEEGVETGGRMDMKDGYKGQGRGWI